MAEVRINITTDAKGAITGIKVVEDGLDKLGKKAKSSGPELSAFGKAGRMAAQDLATFNPAAARASSLLGGFGPAGLGAAAAIGAVTAAVSFGIRELVTMGDRLTNLSRITGITTDALQRMEAFGQPLGITLEQMSSASTKLEKSLGEGGKGVSEALNKLGLSMSDLAAMDADQRLFTVAKALSQLRSPLEQAAAGSALLGRAWAELRLDESDIEEGAEALTGLIKVSSEAIDAGDALGDSWGKLWKNLKNAAAENSSGIAETLTGLITNLDFAIERFTKYNQAQRDAGLGTWSPEMGGSPMRPGRDATGHVDLFRARQRADEAALQVGISSGLALTAGTPEDAAKRHEKGQRAAAAAAREANRVYEDQIRTLLDLDRAVQGLVSGMGLIDAEALGMAESWASTDDEVRAVTADMEEVFAQQAKIGSELGFHMESWEEIRAIVDDYPEGVGDITAETERLRQSQDDYNQALAAANDIAQLLGGTIGSILGQSIGLAASLSNISKVGIGGLFQQGKGDATGILGLIGGIGGIASGIGAIAGPVIAGLKAIFSMGGPDIGRDVGRDIGASISQGLEESIRESGQNAQFFLREIFAEGNLGIDRFVEETADLLSMFERGDISQPAVLTELRKNIPIIIEHLRELGPAGEEQLNRLISGADRLGLQLEELDQLVQGTFAPATLEEFMAQFELSNEQARAFLDQVGASYQTNAERMAASVNLTVEEFDRLQDAVAESLGKEVSGEDLLGILQASGLSAQALAQSLGVEVAAGAGGLTDEAAAANAELLSGVNLSGQLAFNLERAAAAAGGINIPNFNAGAPPDVSAAGGFDSPMLSRDLTIRAHRGEEVHVGQPGSGKSAGGGGVSITINAGNILGPNAKDMVIDWIKEGVRSTKNTRGLNSAIREEIR